MTTSRRTLLVQGAASAVALALAGCGSQDEVITPKATGTATAEVVLTAEKLTEVLERIKGGMDKADEKKDPALLSGYVNGPAARVREAEYVLAAATQDDSHIHVVPATTSQTSSAGVTLDFPRVAVNVTDPPSENEPQRLLVLQQDTARDNFQMWAWVQLFGGVQVPQIASTENGSSQVAADSDEGLKVAPQSVLESYVDAINNPDGDNGKAFADDSLRQKIQADRATDLSGMGEVSIAATVGSDGVLGLSTADGGAIVVSTLSYVTTYKRTVDRSEMKLQGAVAALMGEDTSVVGTVSATYDVMVAFAVPGEGSDDNPVALGAEAVLAKVDRDDSQAPAAS